MQIHDVHLRYGVSFVGNQINSSNDAFVSNSCRIWYHINAGWVPSGQHREVQLDLKTRFS